MTRRINIRRDEGSVLPIVLVVSVVLSLVVVAIATYASATLRHGQVVEEHSDRLAAANGGLDYALDSLLRRPLTCTSAVGESVEVFQGSVNGLLPRIECELVGQALAGVDQYAVIMTGAGGVTGPLLSISGGGQSAQADKTFVGPIFMERLTFDFKADLDIERGDLFHFDAGCPQQSSPSNVTVPSALTFVTQGTGTWCTTFSWTDLFRPKEPIVPPTTGLPTNPAPITDPYGCRVWQKGVYTTPPNFDNKSYNYFVSGDYFFMGGEFATKNSYVLAGYPGPAGPSIVKIKPQDTFQNHPCRFAWAADGIPGVREGDRRGATFYLANNATVYVGGNSALEISGRRQDVPGAGTRTVPVSLQAMTSSTVTGNQKIVTTKSGSGSQLSMQGLVWTPYATFSFSNIANETVAALRGGAVVAALDAGAAAQTNNFLIEVGTSPAATQLLLTASATNQATTEVQALIDYQPSPPVYSVLSRRVVDVTPE